MVFLVGDYLAGMLVGAVTALGVREIIWPGMDMVIAMLLGMMIGMVIHLVVGLLISPLLGMFETMIPAMFIGMYGGMFFAMRDAMSAGSQTLNACVAVGALFGAVVVGGLKVYNRTLRGTVIDAGDFSGGC